MHTQLLLSDLQPGQEAIVQKILSRDDIKRRLEDLGFTKGCKVSCVFCAFAKDPVAYRVRGTLLAIRKKDAKNILMRKGGSTHEKGF